MVDKELIKKLQKLGEEHLKRYHEIRDKVREIEDIPKAKALVGKCFRYVNTYGGGTQTWFYYVRVIRLTKDLGFKLETFEEDSFGKVEMQYDKHGYIAQFQNNNHIEITSKEYFNAQRKLLNKLNAKHKRGVKKK